MSLDAELRELYDIRTRKIRKEKLLSQKVMEVNVDIKNVTIMFTDGICDISVPIEDNEFLEWDAKAKRLVFRKDDSPHYLEGVNPDILIRVRPYLRELVKKAQEIYL